MEVVSEGFQSDLSNHGATDSGPICIEDFPSTEDIFQLEGRSGLSSSRYIQIGLGFLTKISANIVDSYCKI